MIKLDKVLHFFFPLVVEKTKGKKSNVSFLLFLFTVLCHNWYHVALFSHMTFKSPSLVTFCSRQWPTNGGEKLLE